MKQSLLLFFFLFSINAVGQDYNAEWKKVLEYQEAGELKKAAAGADKIFTVAKRLGNDSQLLKSFFYRAKYMQVLEEGAQVKIINSLKAEKAVAKVPTRAIMESLYAEMLWEIYNKNSYAINKRTHIEGSSPANFLEWDRQNFMEEVNLAYKKSIAQRDILYNTPLTAYNEIIDFNPIQVKTNRSLYDFLAERYLQAAYRVSHSNDLKPYAKLLFGDTGQFLEVKIPDSISADIKNKFRLLQELEGFYLKKNDIFSYQRSVLRRLAYFDGLTYNQYDKLYLERADALSTAWGNSLFAYRAKFISATLYNKLSDKNANQNYRKKAVEICKDLLANEAQHDAGPEARNLLNEITSWRLEILTEQHVIPGRPSLASVKFENLDSLKISLYKIDYSEISKRIPSQQYFPDTDSLTPYYQKMYTLPNKQDYFEYTTEIMLPPVEKGYYLVVASPAGVTGKDVKYSMRTIQATDIMLIRQESDNETAYQLVNRATGKPVEKVKAVRGIKVFSSDKSGNIIFPATYVDDYALFTHQGDTLYQKFYKRYNYTGKNEIKVNTRLYLDRPIYRPGQTVFFKGIVVKQQNEEVSLLPNIYVNVVIKDGDYNEIKKIRLLTNEFGSFTGEAVLPKSGMTGKYSLTVEEDEDYEEDEHPLWDNDDLEFDNSRLWFSVEEYKRPTFDVTFNPVKHDIKPDTNTAVTGIAKAFSGAAIQNAKVVYRVECSTITSQYNYYEDDDVNGPITTGETVTDARGNYKIEFKAIPGLNKSGNKLQVYSFTVHADVTDISGETHTASTTVYSGYQSLKLSTSTSPVINSKNENFLSVGSKNLNGEFREAVGEVKVYKVVEKPAALLQRKWSMPEIQSIPEAEFRKHFPYLEYIANKNDSVVHEKQMLEQNVNTATQKEIGLFAKAWPAGKYEAVFTAKDSSGTLVTARTQFVLKRDDSRAPAGLFSYEIKNKNYIKDGFVKVEMQSGRPLLYVNVKAFLNEKEIHYKLAEVKDGSTTIKVPVNKKWHNSLVITFDYVWEGQFNKEKTKVELGSKMQPLEFETQSVTNKLEPGSAQTWSFTIKDSDKIPAEVLASMYDASLDKFTMEDWQQKLPAEIYRYDGILYRHNMTDGTIQMDFYRPYTAREQALRPDGLYTYGFNINQSKNVYLLLKPKGQAQTSTSSVITGIVTAAADGFPVAGVNVTIEGTLEGVQTGIDGSYTIYAPPGSRIEFSFVGMETVKVAVGKSNTLNITLQDDKAMLDEVVVVAYGVQKRESITGSISELKSEGNPVYNQMLTGKLKGVSIQGGGTPGDAPTIRMRGISSLDANSTQPLYVVDGVIVDELKFLAVADVTSMTMLKDAAATSLYGNRGANGVIIISTKQAEKELEALQQVKARGNFNETAFFYPQLRTDEKGAIRFNFTTPEALTKWKLRLLAHNKSGASGYFEKTFITQKELMVVPNMPRFLREKDTIIITAKITSLTDGFKTGQALLQLSDGITMQPADATMLNNAAVRPFTLEAKGSTTVSWKITVPYGMQAVHYKILAKAGNFTDGEENILPVLSSRTLVTESLPLWVKPNTAKEYVFKNVNNTSSTLINHGITLDYTSNPAWAALQSLPYLMEYEHNCAEQVFSRYYANAIAAHIVNANPKIAAVFTEWRKKGVLISNLEKNEELKSILLAETPWLLDTRSESEKRNRLAMLFDTERTQALLKADFIKLESKQLPGGGFAWFEGGDVDPYITRHIVAGLGHMAKLGIKQESTTSSKTMVMKAVNYMDTSFQSDYNNLAKGKKQRMIAPIGHTELHYLYARSFYNVRFKPSDSLQKTINAHLQSIKTNWLHYSLYDKAMAALALHRFGDTITTKKVLLNLRETSALNEENVMYWIENKGGYNWYNSPIETQALLIEAFTEIDNDMAAADAMKVWLLKNRQVKNWPTTKSTTEAVYALLMKGGNWLSVKDNTVFKVGGKDIPADKLAEAETEAAAGTLKITWKAEEITKQTGQLTIENKSAVPGYGGFYWQYFEDMDKIKPAQPGLMNITKELYIKTNTAAGQQLKKIGEGEAYKIGDLVTVQLVLNIAENVEYIHIKDVRAAGFEPVDVLSKYEWRDGLGYYRSSRDATTHFFFDSINKGTYVLEYDVRVNNAGEFSNGISTIQSMYAPEFSGHSKGERVKMQQ